MKPSQVAGKLCLNILLEEDRLDQNKGDIYLAHEVLQMQVLWSRNRIYQKYLESNAWAFKFLPNWIGDSNSSLRAREARRGNLQWKIVSSLSFLAMMLEGIAKRFQLWYMKEPQGMERIEDGALYFHPEDCRSKVLSKYRQKLKKLSTP